jgi:hypothetical protein
MKLLAEQSPIRGRRKISGAPERNRPCSQNPTLFQIEDAGGVAEEINKCCLTPAVIFTKVIQQAMRNRGIVGSLIESHRAKATRPDRRNFLPQTGQHDANDLGSYLGRADIVLGSIANAANLAALKLKGWTDAETTAFQTARNGFGPAEQYRVKSISGAKDTTTQKNADAAMLYENILTIQNAAGLQWPAADPANAGVRGEFLLGIFPPDHGGNHTPAPAPTPAPTAK